MAAITNTAVTKQGLAALAYSKVHGLPIIFTKMALGDGYISGSAEDQTDLINTVLTYDVSNIERHENSQVWVECSMSNDDLTAGFYYREIGLYCKNPENEDEEILYCYGNAGENAEYVVADNSTTAVTKTIRLILNINNDQGVHININDENHATNNYVNAKVAAEEAARLSQLTNCILEIPQDIKLELSDGVLTLKSGSKVYIPNGKDNAGNKIFDTLILEKDELVAPGGSGPNFLMYSENSAWLPNVTHIDYFWGNMYAGETQPEVSVENCVWYDTAKNKMFTSNDTGATWIESRESLPVCICTFTDGTATSIDQSFNGFGYFGNQVFILPGVKGLAADGRNNDGTLKNAIYTTNKVIIEPCGAGIDTYYLLCGDWLRNARIDVYFIQEEKPTLITGNYAVWFCPSENLYRYTNNAGASWITAKWFKLAEYKTLNGVVSSFTPLLPFRAVDYNDFSREQAKLEALINEKDFEIESLGRMMELDLTKLFIQIFEDTSTIDSSKGDGAYCIANYYDADKHIFVKDDMSTKTIYSVAKSVTNGNNQVWAKVDWKSIENGTIKLDISRDGGTTWTTLTQGELTNISTQPAGTSMVLRVTVIGRLKLKNIAWGMKA